MKTIEEKAKRYDEAINKVKSLYKAAEPMSGCNVIIETLFPELKESEDERIRKALVDFMTIMWGNQQDDICGVNVEDAIAWLEKQGEQKPAWNEEDINKPNGGIVMEDFNDGNGFYKVNLAYLNEEQVKEIEELVKRWDGQPKEDEDESIISDLLDYFDEDKCLKHEVNDIVKWLKTIKPQQKGWSDNEIKMFDNLITYLDGRKGLLEEIKRTYIDWLKSIKSRVKPKQEWSEEDQNALEDVREAVVHYWGGDSQDILLYWLKKLKQRIGGEQ